MREGGREGGKEEEEGGREGEGGREEGGVKSLRMWVVVVEKKEVRTCTRKALWVAALCRASARARARGRDR
jgi:hypothetical protein